MQATKSVTAGARTQWDSWSIGDHTKRHRLYINGTETPFFVDQANCRAHFTNGNPVGLFGAGMGSEIRNRDGSSYRIAATLGSFRSVAEAKRAAIAKAEGMAVELLAESKNGASIVGKAGKPELPYLLAESRRTIRLAKNALVRQANRKRLAKTTALRGNGGTCVMRPKQ